MNAEINLQAERANLNHRLAELRERRGAAKLDGRPFDESKIAAVEAALRGLDDAELVSEKRGRAAFAVDRLARHRETVATWKAERENRLAATAEAEKAARALAAALAKAEAAGAREDAAAGALGGDVSNPVNRQTRVFQLMMATLQHGLGARWFANIDLLAGSKGISGTASWRDSEAGHGDISGWLERNKPKN